MAYNITKTDGSSFGTVADGTVDTSSSVSIVGRNYTSYGEILGENFVRLCENFANTSNPSAGLNGQLWFDKTNYVLKYCDYEGGASRVWKQVANMTVNSTAPTSRRRTGDLFYDTDTSQLFAWDGSSFELIGPTVGSSTLSGDLDLDGNDITGTGDINITGTVTASGGFVGTASDSDSLGGVAAANYLRSNAADTTTGTLGIQNDTGLTVGVDDDLEISVSGSDVVIKNVSSDGDIIFNVNDGGSDTEAMRIDGATHLVVVTGDPLDNLGIATKQYVDSATSGASATALQKDGSNAITGSILPDITNTKDLGSTTKVFQTVYATTFEGESTSAQYADVAERFHADAVLEEGTVVEMGGIYEITTAIEELTDNVFGVVSTKPAYLMNSKAGTSDTHPAIAMNGRVPVKVIGQVNKGDRLVSAGNGMARAATAEEVTAFNVIGRSLENKDTEGEGTVEAIVKVN